MRALTGTRRLATWATVGVFGAGAVTGAVLSQTGLASADSSSSTTTPPAAGTPGPGPRHPALGALARAEYGTVTVWGKDKQSHTVQFRRGTGAVSGNSITVTSKDGSSATYTPVTGTKIRLDGKPASLSQLNGKQVRVIVEDTVVKEIASGTAPRPAKQHMTVITGKISNVNGSTFTIGGKTYTLAPNARVFKDGQPSTLSELNGQTVHVLIGPAGKVRAVFEGTPPRPLRGHGPMGPGGPGGAGAPADQQPAPTQTS